MRRIFGLIMLISLIFVGGCWDMREINEIGLVMAVGIDKSPTNSENFLVTVQLANPQEGGSSGDGKKSQSSVWIASAEGKTIFEAIRKLARFSSNRIMWAHNNVIIIGESLAQDDITSVMDFFTHNYELRMKTWVAVGKGNASEFLAASAGMGAVPGQSLGDVFRYQKFTGLNIPSNMLKVYGDFNSEHNNTVLYALTFNEALTQPGLKNKGENTNEQIEVSGMAVFNKNRMQGYLSADESRGLVWVLGQNSNIVVSVPEPENSSKFAAIEVTGIKAEISSVLINDIPEFTVKITGTGNISEEDGFSDLSIDQFKSELEASIEQQIVSEIELSLNKVQKEYQSDVLSLGKVVHAEHKNEWNERIKYQWEDLYPEVEVKVEAKIDIESSALNQIPLRDYKETNINDDQDPN